MDVYPKKSKNCADPTRKCRKLLEIGICMSRSTSVWFDSASLRIPSATINITEQREWELDAFSVKKSYTSDKENLREEDA